LDTKLKVRLPSASLLAQVLQSPPTISANAIVNDNVRNIGDIFAIIISALPAGVINSCSTVPTSFSFTMAVEAIADPSITNNIPIIPVTMNQEFSKPGL